MTREEFEELKAEVLRDAELGSVDLSAEEGFLSFAERAVTRLSGAAAATFVERERVALAKTGGMTAPDSRPGELRLPPGDCDFDFSRGFIFGYNANEIRLLVEVQRLRSEKNNPSGVRPEWCSSCGKPTYAGEDFGGPCVHETDLACALAQRDEARAERDALIGAGCSPEQNALALLDLYAERTRDAEAARDEANANYCFMVQRACDEKLDGYRELGARAAAAENERDALLYRVDSLTCALRCLLMSRDASWTGGHDWAEAVDDACKALGIEPGEDAE